jgi:hypothetical protein
LITLGTRFVDYGLTGGTIVFFSIGLIGWFNPGAGSAVFGLIHAVQNSVATELPSFFESVLGPIMIAFFVVSVFLVGFILDLIGSVFVVWEMNIFRKNLESNQRWIKPVLNKYKVFLGDDMERLLTQFGDPLSKEELKESFRIFVFWRGENWKTFWKNMKRGFLRLRLIKPFNRLQNILFSHLLFHIEHAKLETLSDQLRICRIARAISTGLYLQASLALLAVNLKDITTYTLGSWVEFGLALALSIIGIGLATFMTVRAYSRFCSNLFSLVFVLSKAN